jgi:hypothetical protein
MDYLEGSLLQDEKEAIEKHLGTCEKCMDEIRDFQSIQNTISTSPVETPDSSLKINFYHILQTEIDKQNRSSQPRMKRIIPFTRIAASMALLVGGTFLGMFLNPLLKTNNNNELTQLKNEVQSMKEVVMMNMLNQESPSDRIRAVNYADEISSPNNDVINALVKTLNNDKNVNVRMAAAYSLSKFGNRKLVMDSLVKSLEKQTDPIIQVVLMDILVQKRETRAVKQMQKIILDDNTIKEVKEIAEKNMQILL